MSIILQYDGLLGNMAGTVYGGQVSDYPIFNLDPKFFQFMIIDYVGDKINQIEENPSFVAVDFMKF